MNEPLPRFLTQEALGFTSAEFLRMGEVGAFDDMKVELLGGNLQRMAPPMNEHGGRQASVVIRLSRVVLEELLRVEVAVTVTDDSVLVSDAALLRRPVVGRRPLSADDLLLVVEVAETSARRDLEDKRPLYAAAGIPHYWVVDGSAGVTHVFADPADGDYRSGAEVPFGQPLPVPGSDATVTL